jgi:hypothetical protein
MSFTGISPSYSELSPAGGSSIKPHRGKFAENPMSQVTPFGNTVARQGNKKRQEAGGKRISESSVWRKKIRHEKKRNNHIG